MNEVIFGHSDGVMVVKIVLVLDGDSAAPW